MATTPILRAAMARAIALSLALSGSALAQQPIAEEARTLDTLTVTGSRISVPGVEASSPVASIERNEFLATQQVAVESVLKELPAITASMSSATNFGASGAATINMRGMGDNRTLVLIDGRRPVPFNLENVVDANTIPMSLLQSIEMLTGGASVVYGADAVAGVTNFILRRDFEGVEANAHWGETKYGDGGRRNYEVTFGALSDDGRANAVLSVGYSKVDPVLQGNRPWAVQSINSNTGEPSGSDTTYPSIIGFSGLADLLGLPENRAQIDPESGALVPIYYRYNFNPPNYYQTALERWQSTALARYEFNPYAEGYAQVNYTRSQTAARIAPSGLFLQTVNMPLNNPYLPAPARQQICTILGIAAANCAAGRDGANADGELLYAPMAVGRRMVELGPRNNMFDTKTFQVTTGLRGMLSDHWNYDGYWSYGESNQLRTGGNAAGRSKTLQAVNAIDADQCLDPSGGCVPINLFGAEGSITQAQADFIRLDGYSTQLVEQTNAAFNLDGDLGDFKSPWTDYPIGIAAGVEYRRTRASNRSDVAFKTDGELMGYGVIPDSQGGFTIKEAYLESIIPLISGYAGAENLSVEFGYRHSAFSNTGGFDDNYGSWKYGLTWSPVASLKLRAMKQRATRAPNISELFRPDSRTVQNISTDPCAGTAINRGDINRPGTLTALCMQTGVPDAEVGFIAQPSAGQVSTVVQGNLALSPEKADTTTLGLAWTPNSNLSLTLDYWNIEVNDAITAPTVQDIFLGCYDGGQNPQFAFNDMCRLAAGRDPNTGTYNSLVADGILLPLSNTGFIHKAGIDLGARFGHALPGAFGRMQYALDVSKVTRDDFQAVSVAAKRDCLGYYSTSCWLSHEVRSNLRMSWSIQDVTVTLGWRYYSAIDVEPSTEAVRRYFEPYRHIPSYSYFDLGVSYKAPWNMTLSLAINNALDKTPPLVGSNLGADWQNSGNTFPTWYDALGRYINFGVSFRY